MKKYKLILIIIWMIVIFMFSNHTGKHSGELSNSIIDNTIVKVYEVFNGNVSDDQRKEIINKYSYPVRKLAHFTEFFILGVLCFTFFKDFTRHYIIYSILVCFLYACSDEIHQIFSVDRGPSFIDVLIDTFGSICSIFLMNIKRFKKI